ncbi:MAG: glycerate kinase [Paracoccaceae bacterium]|uniref:glycerate kinase type-2 family protein n=1 Tax=unclassified Seohaeicola TaxID=2641111 RepID=UPI00237B9BAD|nr:MULTISPECIES: glycerate kinase [unclassified Seohaeicola]MDD9708700.1 glycerate kinase [Seohaeicola sp. 4SK31]MDD9737139.1 glycerate kinase [Seohaeicola sp. SP36]MDM7970882.1 glycerate kinase [Paracoccaceae bacterium]
MTSDDRAFLASLFKAAVAAADPRRALAATLPERPKGRTVVIGAGKGAAQLAAAFEDLWDGPLEGVVVTRYGYACPTRQIRVLEAAHPVPDKAGLAATDALFKAVSGLGPDDLVVALICGGGSALLAAPAAGLTLEDEVALNKALLASGAPIGAMNAIRKQISRIKGGRLAAAAHPARVVSLIVSDVPGDDPAQVASGPTVPDDVGRAEALRAVRDHAIDLPDRIVRHLQDAPEDAPKSDDPRFAGNVVQVIASAARSLEAAADVARSTGVEAVILSDAIEGEAREVARMHGAMAREVAQRGRPFAAPVVMLSGGETTVTIKGDHGRGGRNSEFMLSLALEIEGCAGISALAADTDGIDGSEDNAGAFADGQTVTRMRAAGLDPAALLAGHDAWSAFDAVGQLFVTGPTGTNVNDLRAILIRT